MQHPSTVQQAQDFSELLFNNQKPKNGCQEKKKERKTQFQEKN